jgi:hypothetical protein
MSRKGRLREEVVAAARFAFMKKGRPCVGTRKQATKEISKGG